MRFPLWTPDPTSASKLQWVKRITDFCYFYLKAIIIFLSLGLAIGFLIFGKLLGAITSLSVSAIMIFARYLQLYRYYKIRKYIISFLAEHMATVQTFLKSARKINNLVMAHPKLKELYKDELKAVRHLWAMGKKAK